MHVLPVGKDRVGRFEAAGGGTIFLDEIGEASRKIQVKLLRILENRKFERVGENRTRAADVWIIAATNAVLETKVAEGAFRKDLFYRLSIITLNLPPLRHREGDIPLLAEHFLEHYNHAFGKAVHGFDDAAQRLIMTYAWPGNVRELNRGRGESPVGTGKNEMSHSPGIALKKQAFLRLAGAPGNRCFLREKYS